MTQQQKVIRQQFYKALARLVARRAKANGKNGKP